MSDRRFMTPRASWLVNYDPAFLITNRYLEEDVARQMLAYGDFYKDGTKILISRLDLIVHVKGKALYTDENCTMGLTYSRQFSLLKNAPTQTHINPRKTVKLHSSSQT